MNRWLTVLLCVPALAFATGKGGDNPEQAQLQQQAQSQAQSQKQAAHGGNASIAEGAVSVAVEGDAGNEVSIDQGDVVLNQSTNTKQKRQAPSVFSPSINPTAPCIVTGSAGVSAPGFGVGLGGGKQDKECTLRETARMFAEMGQTSFALQMLCASEAVKRVGLEGICPTDHVPEPPDSLHITMGGECCKAGEKLERCERQCKGGPKGPPPPPDEMLKDE